MNDDREHSIRKDLEPETLPVLPPPEAEGDGPAAELIGPTPAILREVVGTRPVTIMLTSDAVWIQEAYRLRTVFIRDLADLESARTGKRMWLERRMENAVDKSILEFRTEKEAVRWQRELVLAHKASPASESPPAPEGVALVRKPPPGEQIFLGSVDFSGADRGNADRGMQLRAARLGADAVIHVQRRRFADQGFQGTYSWGDAVRVADADTRRRLRLRFFGEEVDSLVKWALILLIAQFVLLAIFWNIGRDASRYLGWSDLNPGETLMQYATAAGIVYGCALAFIAALWLTKSPRLLKAMGLSVLAATTGRWAVVVLAHFAAQASVGASGPADLFKAVLDPGNWILVLGGIWICRRAWRLARDARSILPLTTHPDRAFVDNRSRLALAASAVVSIAMLAFVGYGRFEMSEYDSNPAVNPVREREAQQAFQDGVAQMDRGNLVAAEASLQRSLKIMDELTAHAKAPAAYHVQRAVTLYDLGVLAEKNGNTQSAVNYYSKAVLAAERFDSELSDEFRKGLSYAREFVEAASKADIAQKLQEKEKLASRKYEEFQVNIDMDPEGAEKLLREANDAWEEVLKQANVPDYLKEAHGNLAGTHLTSAKLLLLLGRERDAERAVEKSVDHGEQALKLDPERPLVKKNLDEARKLLELLRRH